MSHSNCCFLTCIKVLQEAGKVVWYLHLLKNFPVCCDPHSQRLKCRQWSRSRFFFLILLLFLWFNDGNFISGSSAFSKPACTSRSSQFTYCWRVGKEYLGLSLGRISASTCQVARIYGPWPSTQLGETAHQGTHGQIWGQIPADKCILSQSRQCWLLAKLRSVTLSNIFQTS